MQNIEEIIKKLETEIEHFKAENESFKVEIESLKVEVKSLKTENAALRIENASLKEKLGISSKNSSIPSSKELYKLKKEQSKSDRKIGAQPGHEGKQRHKLVADEVISVLLPAVCRCGGTIGLSREPYIHQKVDLPAIKPYVVEYQLQHGRCRKCGKRKAAQLPKEVASAMFGPRIKSVISSLTGFYQNSKQEVVDILKGIFNLDISIGSILNSEARVSCKCQESYEEIEQQITQSKVLHIDETSHYNKGKLGWCWMFASNSESLIKLTDSRGKKILENSVFGKKDI